MSGQLLTNVLVFGRILRGLGLDAGPDRMIDLVRALDDVRIGSRSDFYNTARALFVRRREEIPRFDRAFEVFWRKPARGSTTLDLRAMGERRRFRRAPFAPARAGTTSREPGPDTTNGANDPPRLEATLTYSAREVLRQKDFSELTADELRTARDSIRGLAWSLPEKPVRRRKAGGRGSIDLRRTLRHGLRHGGEVLEWARRERQRRARPLVVLADISGSMERYTRLLLLFFHALSAELDSRVETFLFGTRLTRVTRQLSERDLDSVLTRVSLAVPDWSGGTRIGEALREFNFRWSRRVRTAGAIVLLISDGWDRGEPELLAAEMARLQRSAHRLVWLNPLLGSPEYEPLTRGIRTALPYIDDFLPIHNLASLEDLARRLEDLSGRRPVRRQHALVAAKERLG